MGAADGSVEWLDRDLEARKHLWFGLKRLSTARRCEFLKTMCDKTKGALAEAKITAQTGTVSEAYWDLCYLAVLHGVSLSESCKVLEAWLRREG